MAPIVLTLVQGLFLLLLYLFVWRIARAVLRDVRGNAPAPRASAPARPRRAAAAPTPPPERSRRREPRGRPRQLVVHRSGGRPTVLDLNGTDISFGRASTSTVVLDDPYVSDRHAQVSLEGADWVVRDLGSTNGTFLNQARVTTPTPLSAGDQLGIGKTTVEVRR